MIPVILSGGSGTRLWPSSRSHFPKQYFSFIDNKTMLQSSILGLEGSIVESSPIVVCNHSHGHMVKSQLDEIERTAKQIILESAPRGTASAITLAAISALDEDTEAILLILPIDHVITRNEDFHEALLKAKALALKDLIVTLGIKPNQSVPHYCYLNAKKSLDDILYINSITNDPDHDELAKLSANPYAFWGTGIFVCKAKVFLDLMQIKHAEVVMTCKKSILQKTKQSIIEIDAIDFDSLHNLSINKAIIKNTERAVVLPMDAGWSNLNNWSSLWDISKKDKQGNVINGDVITIDSENNYVQNDTKLISLIGVKNLIVVETDDAILIAHRSKGNEVKNLVAQLKKIARKETLSHRKIRCAWGEYDNLAQGGRFQVQHIAVKKKESFFMQKHHHRAKHWIVVQGTAMIDIGSDQILLTENQSVFIPIGTEHKLENPGNITLELIEIQSGSYLGEDDIVMTNHEVSHIKH